MDRFVGSTWTRSVVGVRGPGVSVFGLPPGQGTSLCIIRVRLDFKFTCCVGGPIRLPSRAKDELLLKFWLTEQFLFY